VIRNNNRFKCIVAVICILIFLGSIIDEQTFFLNNADINILKHDSGICFNHNIILLRSAFVKTISQIIKQKIDWHINENCPQKLIVPNLNFTQGPAILPVMQLCRKFNNSAHLKNTPVSRKPFFEPDDIFRPPEYI
jgi:hypothetical protein